MSLLFSLHKHQTWLYVLSTQIILMTQRLLLSLVCDYEAHGAFFCSVDWSRRTIQPNICFFSSLKLFFIGLSSPPCHAQTPNAHCFNWIGISFTAAGCYGGAWLWELRRAVAGEIIFLSPVLSCWISFILLQCRVWRVVLPLRRRAKWLQKIVLRTLKTVRTISYRLARKQGNLILYYRRITLFSILNTL